MARGINRVTILGNCTKPAELRFTQSQQPVLSFSVAVNDGYWDDKAKEFKERVEFFNCVQWGKSAESLNKILDKGKQVLVEGRLQTRSWEDKTGGKRYTTEIVASNVILLGGKGQAETSAGSDDDIPRNPPRQPAASGYGDQSQQFGVDDDSIPF